MKKTALCGGGEMLMDGFQNKLEFSGYDIPKQEVRLQYWKRDKGGKKHTLKSLL